ncbi:MAG TPA: anthranilate phosphoribosyltransferase [Pirellulales bacterium]|jgi:anthranilate phosphoribosyltransferase|nr:anthranilate phosphoribosyltransferase [Pirellulales bacterium]
MIDSLLENLTQGRDLTFDDMRVVTGRIMQGGCSDEQIARLLTLLAAKGETVDEVAGAAAAMREQMTPIRTTRTGVLDTCGTGGDGSGTFNISTAAALVVAAAGVPVAKHGNRGITSRSGSADALAALGVNVAADVPTVEACLDELGICFCFAPLLHQSMKQVAPIRRQLGIPTIFNLLGPLSNPARAEYQLLGVGKARLRPLLAAALARLGVRRAAVVSGDDGLDEVTLAGGTTVTDVIGASLSESRWTPEDFGLRSASLDPLRVAGPDESAAMIRQVLSGMAGVARDVVVLNAAAGLWIVGRSDSPRQAAEMAAAAIDSGAAARLLAQLAKATQR